MLFSKTLNIVAVPLYLLHQASEMRRGMHLSGSIIVVMALLGEPYIVQLPLRRRP